MLLYNITIGIDKDIEHEWIAWVKENFIPQVMATGLFLDSRMYKVLHDDDNGSISYSIQYFARSIKEVTQYLQLFAPEIIERHRNQFINKHVAFQTLLEEVE
jgi:hypothetical protein